MCFRNFYILFLLLKLICKRGSNFNFEKRAFGTPPGMPQSYGVFANCFKGEQVSKAFDEKAETVEQQS